MTAKTVAEVRAEFLRTGTTITQWAAAHGLPRSIVYELLSGRKRGAFGDAHKAAVLLGLKEGVVPDVDNDPAEGRK